MAVFQARHTQLGAPWPKWRAQSTVCFKLHPHPQQPASEILAEHSHLQTNASIALLTVPSWWLSNALSHLILAHSPVSQKNCPVTSGTLRFKCWSNHWLASWILSNLILLETMGGGEQEMDDWKQSQPLLWLPWFLAVNYSLCLLKTTN